MDPPTRRTVGPGDRNAQTRVTHPPATPHGRARGNELQGSLSPGSGTGVHASRADRFGLIVSKLRRGPACTRPFYHLLVLGMMGSSGPRQLSLVWLSLGWYSGTDTHTLVQEAASHGTAFTRVPPWPSPYAGNKGKQRKPGVKGRLRPGGVYGCYRPPNRPPLADGRNFRTVRTVAPMVY